jgi:hypothetical protein
MQVATASATTAFSDSCMPAAAVKLQGGWGFTREYELSKGRSDELLRGSSYSVSRSCTAASKLLQVRAWRQAGGRESDLRQAVGA